MIKVVELFAGVGGFRLAFEKNKRFEVIWANQWEPSIKSQHAFACYTHHFKKGKHVNQDIRTISSDKIPNHDVLVAGFPCKDYSVARVNAEGLKGEKGSLFWEIARILRDKQPHSFLLENVDNILKTPKINRGDDFLSILKTFDELGYYVEWRVLKASDYGFPTSRKRLFLFGTRLFQNDSFFDSIFPVRNTSESTTIPLYSELNQQKKSPFLDAGTSKNGVITTKKVTPLTDNLTPISSVLEKVTTNDFDITDIDAWSYLKGKKTIQRIHKTGKRWNYSEGSMRFPDSLDLPARTIITSEGTKRRETHVILDPNRATLRTLTPLECERIMGFPDNWTVMVPKRWRYVCMGNALVVGLVEKMANQIDRIF